MVKLRLFLRLQKQAHFYFLRFYFNFLTGFLTDFFIFCKIQSKK